MILNRNQEKTFAIRFTLVSERVDIIEYFLSTVEVES